MAKMKTCLFAACVLCVFLKIQKAKCDILVYTQSTNQIMQEFQDMPARFGGALPENGMRVLAVAGEPANGCAEMKAPPNVTNFFTLNPAKFAALIIRYNCSFEEKVRNAQNAGFQAVIVYNLRSDALEQMSANNAEDIYIPSVFVGENTGKTILYNYLYDEGFALVLTDEIPFNINTHLILPFAVVIGMCFVIMIVFMIVRCVRERRRMLRHRLPGSVLKKIPIIKFNKNMHYETCAICLDDYAEGEKLRVLPCHHAYHAKCIDPWLTKTRRVCPICKRKVFARGERRTPRRRRSSSDSLSSSEADESTPLLNPVNNSVSSVVTSPRSTTNNSEHAVNVMSEDDEILDDANVQNSDVAPILTNPQSSQWRFNPFDRIVPQHDAVNANETTETSWQKFKRFFARRSPDDPIVSEVGNSQAQDAPATNIEIRQPSSNNITNSNLSGSFKDEDDSGDEPILGQNTRFNRHQRQIRSAPDLPSTSSGSSPARLGVVALPNIHFNPNLGNSSSTSNNNQRQKRNTNNVV